VSESGGGGRGKGKGSLPGQGKEVTGLCLHCKALQVFQQQCVTYLLLSKHACIPLYLKLHSEWRIV
jgi:hypothetical protein